MSKFCIMKYVEDYEYLSNKFVFFKNKKVREFYIKKFNPFRIETLIFGNLEEYEGILISIPITLEDAKNNEELSKYLVDKTVKYLNVQGVNIVYYKNIITKSDELNELKHIDVMNIYINDIINRVVKACEFNRRNLSISVIAGDFGHTCLILKEVHNDLNFLSLAIKSEDFVYYEEITDEIFCDSGLEVSSVNSVKGADIIINLSKSPLDFLVDIKKTAVIIDLVNSIGNNFSTNNMLIEGISVKLNNRYLSDYELELLLYAYNRNYRNFKNNLFEMDKFLSVKNDLKLRGISFCSYYTKKK